MALDKRPGHDGQVKRGKRKLEIRVEAALNKIAYIDTLHTLHMWYYTFSVIGEQVTKSTLEVVYNIFLKFPLYFSSVNILWTPLTHKVLLDTEGDAKTRGSSPKERMIQSSTAQQDFLWWQCSLSAPASEVATRRYSTLQVWLTWLGTWSFSLFTFI